MLWSSESDEPRASESRRRLSRLTTSLSALSIASEVDSVPRIRLARPTSERSSITVVGVRGMSLFSSRASTDR